MTVRKEAHCTYCGRMISSCTFFTADDAHLQHVKVVAVCDKCMKASELNYAYHDLIEKKEIPPAAIPKCIRCGGTISREYGYCRACAWPLEKETENRNG